MNGFFENTLFWNWKKRQVLLVEVFLVKLADWKKLFIIHHTIKEMNFREVCQGLSRPGTIQET